MYLYHMQNKRGPGMEKTPIIYFYYAAKSQKKGTSYTSKCKRFLKLMTL